VIPAGFDYRRPASVEEAIGLLADLGDDAKVLAGGHSLLPIMKLRLTAPGTLIDIGRLPGLRGIELDGDEVVVGALSRHADLAGSELLAQHSPLLAHVAGMVADPQIRNRGTIGGSLVHADPAADLPAAVLALDGSMVLRGPDGERRVRATSFFTGFLSSDVRPGELLVQVRVPSTAGAAWGYQKFVRRANDWAIVAAAAVDGRVALAGMGTTPLRATGTEQALAGGESVEAASELADQGTEPTEDMHAGEEYRRHLARLLTRRALQGARGRA
jgi:aerobic carbon-monoxide dehydrogenase medium subunit